ncbi:MAG: protein kinase, partial [Myxococcaceae bacterium]|nr:protein kinase [Myxococcaceae bacterium]
MLRKLPTGTSDDAFLGQLLDVEPPRWVVVHRAPASDAFAFRGPANACVGLRHTHLVEVIDVAQHAGRHLHIHEFVDGVSLRVLLRAANDAQLWPDLRETCFLMQGLAEGVAKVRDRCPAGTLLPISAERVMIDTHGNVKLNLPLAYVDTRLGDAPFLTALSSHSAVAPEQLHGQPANARSDVYLLGLLMFELLSSKPLFNAASGMKGLTELAQLDVMKLPWEPSVPHEFKPIVLQSLATSPEHRYPSVRDFADALSDFVASQTGPVSGDDIAKMFKLMFPERRSGLEDGAPLPAEEWVLDTPKKAETSSPRPSPTVLGSSTLGRVQTRRITADELRVIRAEEEKEAREAARAMPDGPISVPDDSDEEPPGTPFEQRLGHILLKRGKATHEALRLAFRTWQKVKGRFIDVLVDSGVVSDEDALGALAEASQRPYIATAKLRAMPPPKDALLHLGEADAGRLGVVPLSLFNDRQLFVAVPDGFDEQAFDELKFITGFSAVIGVLAQASAIRDAQDRFYRGAKAAIELP